jgi:hypothetical protein
LIAGRIEAFADQLESRLKAVEQSGPVQIFLPRKKVPALLPFGVMLGSMLLSKS